MELEFNGVQDEYEEETAVPATLGKRVRQARLAKGWNQEKLGIESKLSQNYISDIERDKPDPAISTITSLAKSLGVSLDYLVPSMGVDDPAPHARKPIGSREAEIAARMINALPADERRDCISLLSSMMSGYQRRKKENEETMRTILLAIERFGGRELRRLTAQELGIYGLFSDEGDGELLQIVEHAGSGSN